MILERPHELLKLVEHPDPEPSASEVLVRVAACGVCRTDLYVIDGELPDPRLPIVPGHEIVGYIEGVGTGVGILATGMRVGILWLGHTCGRCHYCRAPAVTRRTLSPMVL
jgi:propanol-preferring alcohol dehydrogenase